MGEARGRVSDIIAQGVVEPVCTVDLEIDIRGQMVVVHAKDSRMVIAVCSERMKEEPSCFRESER